MKLPKLLFPFTAGGLMLMLAPPVLAQSQSTLAVTIAQTRDICDPVTSYSQSVNSSPQINTNWVTVSLIGVCTNANSGFRLSVSSLRQGQLQRGNNIQYVMPYQVKSVCAGSANGPTGTRTDVCNIPGRPAVPGDFKTFKPSNAFREIFNTPGCQGVTGQDRGNCNQAFNNGVQVGIQIQLDGTVQSTAYPAGTYTDTIYYTLQDY